MHSSKIISLVQQGIQYQTSGDEANAERVFRSALRIQPSNAPALYSLAAIAANRNKLLEALGFIDRAIRANKGFSLAYLARSKIYMRLARITDALKDLEMVKSLDPQTEGIAEHEAVLKTFSQVVGSGLDKVSQEVQELLAKALSLQNAGHVSEAKAIFTDILARSPDDFVSNYSMGVIASRDGSHDEALAFFTTAVTVAPANSQALNALATTYQAMALYEKALDYFDKAIASDLTNIDPVNNKVTLLHTLGRQLDAIHCLDEALRHNPDNQKCLGNKGYLLTEFKQNAAAAAVFARLLEINPDYEYAEGLHVLARLHACDWSTFEESRTRILQGLEQERRVCNPFALMSVTDDPQAHFKSAEIFGLHRFPEAKFALWNGEKYLHQKKRVAFISADFREHPVGYLLIGLIERLDKNQFETIGVSLCRNDNSDLYKRYRCAFDHYLHCAEKPSLEIAKLLRSMEVDILVDLSGYTSGARLDILSFRPAPAQATYLGFPGGLNLPYVDYLIADKITIPEEQQKHYREKILYLPHCYLPRDVMVRPAQTPMLRTDHGLPLDAPIFCSFNHGYKINPLLFPTWMELLRQHPKSVLWLMKQTDDAASNLKRTATSYDIDPARLVFASRVPRVEDHLARYRLADVFLDTFPYNGHTTAGDALLAGLPVVTLAGKGFQSRVAASILNDFGLGSLSVSSIQGYVEKANEILNGSYESISQADNIWPISLERQSSAFSEALSTIG